MELLKWQTVLTEWVNCLSIVPPIRTLQELRNEELLKKLVLELNENKLDRACNVSSVCVADFFKTHFPDYQFESELVENQDMTEITYACSLLLYYCCVIDCRVEFINALCENLSYASQICVKHFLEDLQSRQAITRDTLKISISATNKYLSTPSKTLLSPYNSPKHAKEGGYFLQEFLKTPIKKYQRCIEQHKKEIKVLVDQLEVERLEKSDLQEELKSQYERNKSLENKISTKTREVSRLRSELLALESHRPVADDNAGSHLENKRLRTEIDSLEKYVGILHQEGDELRAERDTARSKLSRLEEQCKAWQGKALEAERQCSELSLELQKQQSELDGLREHSEELGRMLMEFRPRRGMDESYEMDSSQSDLCLQNKSGIIDCESLAHTVVDLQLLDAQQENDNLKKQLMSLQELIKDKDSQFEDIQKKFETSQHALKSSVEENIELVKKNEFSKAEVKDLSSQLHETDVRLTEMQSENEKLYADLKIALEKCKDFVTELNDLNKKYQHLQLEKDSLQTTWNTTLKQLQDATETNESYKTTLSAFNNHMQSCLSRFESLLERDLPLQTKDDFEKFNCLLKELELKNFEECKHSALLREDCDNIKKQLFQLESEVLRLNENEERATTEINRLNDALEASGNKIKILEDAVASYESLLNEQKAMIVGKNEVIDKQNMEINAKIEEIKVFDGKVCELSKEVERLEKQVLEEQQSKEKAEKAGAVLKAKYETEITYFNDKMEEKTRHADELQKVIDYACAIISNIVNLSYKTDLKSNVSALREHLNNSAVEREQLSSNLNALTKELSTCKNICEQYNDEIVSKLIEFNKNISKSFTNIHETGDTVEVLTDSSEKLKTITNKQILNIANYILNINNKFETLKLNLQGIINDKKQTNKDIQVLNEEKSNLSKENDKNKQLIGHLTEVNNKLQKDIENYQNKYKSLDETFKKFQVDVEDRTKQHQADVEKYQKNIYHLQEEKKTLLNTTVDLKSELESLQSKYEKSLDESSEAQKGLKEAYELEISRLESSQNDDIHSMENSFKTVRMALEESINKYKADLEKSQDIVGELRAENKHLINDLYQARLETTELQKKFSSMEAKLQEAMINLEQTLDEKEKMKRELDENVSKLTEIETELKEALEKHRTEIEGNKTTVKELKERNNELEKLLRETKMSLEKLTEDNNKEVTNYKDVIKVLTDQNAELEKCLKESESREEQQKIQLNSLECKLQEVNKNYDDTLFEKRTLKEKTDEEVNNLKAVLEHLNKEHAEEIEILKKELSLRKDTGAKLEEIIAELKSENERLGKKLQDEIVSLTSERDNMKSDIKNLLKELDDSRESNEVLKEILNNGGVLQTELQQKIAQLQTELSELKNVNSTLNSQIAAVNKKILIKEKDKEYLQNVYEEYVKTTDAKISEMQTEHDIELEKSKAEIDALITDLVTVKENISALESTRDAVVNEKNNRIEKLIKKNMEFKEKLEDVEQKLAEVQKELDENRYVFHLYCENIRDMLERRLKSNAEKNDAHVELDNKYKSSNIINEHLCNLKKQITDVLNEKDKMNKHEKNELNEKIVEIESKMMKQAKQYESKIAKVLESKNKEIEVLERDLKKTNCIVEEKLQEITTLKNKLDAATISIDSQERQYSNFAKTVQDMRCRLLDLIEARDELFKIHFAMVKETSASIGTVRKGIRYSNSYFEKKLEVCEREKEHEIEQKKHFENLLMSERNNTGSLQENLHQVSLDKKQATDLCWLLFGYIRNLNKITENQSVCEIEQVDKSEECDLEYLFNEKEAIDKIYTKILVEILRIQKELRSYEILKEDYTSLTNKYEILSVCENENNSLKMIKAEMEHKLFDLQQENIKYQNTIKESEQYIENIRKENDLLKQTSNETSGELQALEEAHKEALGKIAEFSKKNEELKEKNANLSEINEEHESKTGALERKLKDYESLLIENQFEYQNLKKRYNEITDQNADLKNQVSSFEQKLGHLQKIIEDLEAEYQNLTKRYDDLSEKHKFLVDKCSAETDSSEKQENIKLRAAYSELMGEISRLQLDCSILRKTVEERNAQLSELSLMKEAYEKLLEDNNKVCTEIDTLRYKRARDKEEFKRILEEERNKSESNVDTRIQMVRNEYEEKLRYMKEKIVNLYTAEMDKEKRKKAAEQQEYSKALESIASLKSQLWVTSNKYAELKKEYEKLQVQLESKNIMNQTITISRDDLHSSRESVSSLQERRVVRETAERRLATLPRDAKLSSTVPVKMEETVTLVTKRSITPAQTNLESGLKMEDEEGEMFNNVYLADLKAGICVPPSANTSTRDSVCRLSELQYRNSLCPPHLKSSYPAETQFSSPSQFKEDDIKMGQVDLDDSMSSSLLPSDKPRTKKDWGQTMYKKPGPPTPSKNGGRHSLQGNEVHPREVLREHNDNPKPQQSRSSSTPNRLKALFSAKSSSQQRNEIENQASPAKRKGRSIFRLHR